MVEGIITMAQLTLCRYYHQIPLNNLIDDILNLTKWSLMMNNIPGIIIFDYDQQNFKYIYKYDQSNYSH